MVSLIKAVSQGMLLFVETLWLCMSLEQSTDGLVCFPPSLCLSYSLDGYMNVSMENTEEFSPDRPNAQYIGDAFIRGNNGMLHA